MPERSWCDACGAEKIDGKHPNTTCSEKEWAAHQGRMLREIIIALNKSEIIIALNKMAAVK
jgi:hypothetical protein